MRFTFFKKYLKYFLTGLLVSTLCFTFSCEEEKTPTDETDKTENTNSDPQKPTVDSDTKSPTEKEEPTPNNLTDAQKVLESL